MTDNQISRALAIAIGWKRKEITESYFMATLGKREHWGVVVLLRESTVFQRTREFDYRDPTVILPLVTHFELEMSYSKINKWTAWKGIHKIKANANYYKAAALAIIEMQKGKV